RDLRAVREGTRTPTASVVRWRHRRQVEVTQGTSAPRPPARLSSLAASVTVSVVVTTSVGAQARSGPPPVPVSGPSPYAGCQAPLLHGERTYVDAEVEPWIAVDPSDPKR